MSLLKSIKGTFKNVQDDISESLKALSVTPEKPRPPEPQPPLHVSTVNYDAGAEVLHRNENVWKDLYQYSETTAQKAQNVDIQIGNLFIHVDKQSEVVERVHNEVSALPKLIMQLQEITNVLAQVEEEYDKVEAALVYLENICEEQEYHRNIASHHKQLAVYKMKKEHELDNYKVHLAREHARKVENINKRKQHMQHEKQVTYEEEFAKDVDYFKKHGKPGRLPSSPESDKKLDISDVQIEEDSGELDAFLESSDNPESDLREKSEDCDPSDEDVSTTEIIPEITSPSESRSEITSPSDGDNTEQSETEADNSEIDSSNVEVSSSGGTKDTTEQCQAKTDSTEGDSASAGVNSPDNKSDSNDD